MYSRVCSLFNIFYLSRQQMQNVFSAANKENVSYSDTRNTIRHTSIA